jgi:hypothetical protein
LKIQGTQSVEVNVSMIDVVSGVIDLIRTKHKIWAYDFIEDGKLMNYEENRHGSSSKYVRRQATKQDAKALEMMEFLLSLLKSEVPND